jgi:hypothetical protein
MPCIDCNASFPAVRLEPRIQLQHRGVQVNLDVRQKRAGNCTTHDANDVTSELQAARLITRQPAKSVRLLYSSGATRKWDQVTQRPPSLLLRASDRSPWRPSLQLPVHELA